MHPTEVLRVSLKVPGVWPHDTFNLNYQDLPTHLSRPSPQHPHHSLPASVLFLSLELSCHKLTLSHCTSVHSLLLLICKLCCPRSSEVLTILRTELVTRHQEVLRQTDWNLSFTARSSTIVLSHFLFRQNPGLSELGH